MRLVVVETVIGRYLVVPWL